MANFEIISDGPYSFAVKVTFDGGRTQTVRGFRTRLDAQVWVDAQTARVTDVGSEGTT
jgi:hypothetical protein